jgi:hypothetical protein
MSQLADAIARGDLLLRQADQTPQTFGLESALPLLARETSRSKSGQIRSIRLHADEMSALETAGRTYRVMAGAEPDVSALVSRVENLIAAGESGRIAIAQKIGLLLGKQDAVESRTRDGAEVDELAKVFADVPFAIDDGIRNTILNVLRTSYAAGNRTRAFRGVK